MNKHISKILKFLSNDFRLNKEKSKELPKVELKNILNDSIPMLTKIAEEIDAELSKTPMVYASVMAHARENLEYKWSSKEKRIFVGDMKTTIHASIDQKRVMGKLLDKYGDFVLEQVFFELVKKKHTVTEDVKEKWR